MTTLETDGTMPDLMGTHSTTRKTRRPGRPRKRDSLGSRDEIRARLVGATLDIVRDEGVAAVSTTRLMRALGMSQSGFYQFFASADECLNAAASKFGDSIRRELSSFRKQLWLDAIGELDEDSVRERVRRGFEHSLTVSLSEPRLAELMMFFRYRLDHSALGRALHQVSVQAREDMVREIVQSEKRKGQRKLDVAAVRVYAGFLFVLWAGAVEMLLEDPKLDRNLVCDMLTRSAIAAYPDDATAPAQPPKALARAAKTARPRRARPRS